MGKTEKRERGPGRRWGKREREVEGERQRIHCRNHSTSRAGAMVPTLPRKLSKSPAEILESLLRKTNPHPRCCYSHLPGLIRTRRVCLLSAHTTGSDCHGMYVVCHRPVEDKRGQRGHTARRDLYSHGRAQG